MSVGEQSLTKPRCEEASSSADSAHIRPKPHQKWWNLSFLATPGRKSWGAGAHQGPVPDLPVLRDALRNELHLAEAAIPPVSLRDDA
eukprot:scaffold31378_cov21-Tisochrysis_lutea.AAC.1